MRDIRFRGQDMNGHWIIGLLTKKKIRSSGKISFAIATGNCSQGETVPVSEHSVGQFTGFTDANDQDIFEGDILVPKQDAVINPKPVKLIAGFRNGSFSFFNEQDQFITIIHQLFAKERVIIGNIFDR